MMTPADLEAIAGATAIWAQRWPTSRPSQRTSGSPSYHCPRGMSDAVADVDFELAIANAKAKTLDR